MFSSQEETANTSRNGATDDSSSIITYRKPDKYIPNANDIRIIAGNATLIITDNKSIGGLWAGVSNYDPCSGSEQECFDAMRNLISSNFEEACETLIFKLDKNLFLLNIADCQNRGAYDEDGLFYLHLCEDKIGVFYPIIRNFIETMSSGKRFGVTICFGGGTSIGLCSLVYKLKEDGFSYFVLGTTLPFPQKKEESWSERRGKSIDNFEWFDCTPYIDKSKSIIKIYEEDIEVIFNAMKAKVTDMLSSYLESEERHGAINKENGTDKPDVLTHEAKLPGQVLQVNEVLDKSVNNGSEISQKELRIHNGVARPDYTPNVISSLKADEVFVFGSNLHGHHGGGAARVAWKNFGAIRGQGVGLQGQSYAIPTMQGGIETIKPYVDQFIDFAKEHAELFFYVTRIGCGIAGFKDSDIAPLFRNAIEIANICLPKSFVDILKNPNAASQANVDQRPVENSKFCCPKHIRLSEYGYIRTIADIIKVLNQSNCYTDPKVMEHDLQTVLEPYRKRGTVSQSSIDAFRFLINQYSDILFDKNGLDINELARVIDKIPSEGLTPIDEVLSFRQKAKILYAVEFANKICKYTNPNNLIYDLQGLFWGNSTFGWHTKLLDDFHPHTDYGVRFFLENITKAWSSVTSVDRITKEKTLNNDLLESYMFSEHEMKIKEKGLVSTLKEDYEEVPGCHSTRLMPKRPGAGPIYVINDDKQIQRACHPSDDTLIHKEFYELGFIEILIRNMIARHEYAEFQGGPIYVPVNDYSKPIFDGNYREMHFESMEEKCEFISRVRRDGGWFC
jgi:hypothetical protein